MTSKTQLTPLQSNQSGFTILESLMAVLVVTVLLVAISPVIVLSVATRVQARRVDIATDAAKSYIDALRSGAIAPPPISDVDSETVLAPSAPTGCDSNAYCTTPSGLNYQVYCVDGDQDGTCENGDFKDMLVQAIGYQSTPTIAREGYQLSVRVYRADATGNLTAGDVQNAFTGGTGVNLDSQLPLVEMETEIIPDDATYSDLCKRLGCG